MELKTMEDLLATDKEAIQKYNIEQLRLVLGVARYFARSVEREINRRESSVEDNGLIFL